MQVSGDRALDHWALASADRSDSGSSASLSCVYDKIRMYKCSKDRDTTPLTLFSSFMRNVSHVCTIASVSANGKATSGWYVVRANAH